VHAAASTEGPVLLVTHGAALQMLIRHVVGIAPSSERRFLVPNVGLSTFVHARGQWFARTLSDTTHLAAAGLDSFPNE